MNATTDLRPDPSAIPALEAVRRDLLEQLDLVSCSYEPWPFDLLLPRIERGRIVLPADAVGARPCKDWVPADGIELPLRMDGMRLGRFVLVPSSPTTGVMLGISERNRALDIAEGCVTALAGRLTEGASSWPT